MNVGGSIQISGTDLLSTNLSYNEKELVQLLQQKDNAGFSYLYDSYAGALYNIIRQIIDDVELANDVLQEVFISIWKKIDMYDPEKGRLFTWMLNIARNAAIDKKRSKNFRQGLKQQPIEESDLLQISVRPGVDDYGLKKMIYKLKDEHRLLIDLSFYQGFTHDQIAKSLNMPLGTVKTRIRSALIQLRTLLS